MFGSVSDAAIFSMFRAGQPLISSLGADVSSAHKMQTYSDHWDMQCCSTHEVWAFFLQDARLFYADLKTKMDLTEFRS